MSPPHVLLTKVSRVDKLGAVLPMGALFLFRHFRVGGTLYLMVFFSLLEIFSSIEKTGGGQDKHTRFPPYSLCFMHGPVGVKDRFYSLGLGILLGCLPKMTVVATTNTFPSHSHTFLL